MSDLYDRSIADRHVPQINAALRGAFRSGGRSAVSRFDLEIDFDLVEPKAVEFAEERGAEMVGRRMVDGRLEDNPDADWSVEETTRARLREIESEAIEEGWSAAQLEERIEEAGLFTDARAEMIARTEIGRAEGLGHAAAYRVAGVEYVYIYDGDSDEECIAANGETWTLEEYEANPLEHPNCERDARPLTGRELDEMED